MNENASSSTVYKIADGRLWSVAKSCFISEAPEGSIVEELWSSTGSADEAYLKRTLESYGLKVGYELLTLDEAKAAKLKEINAACDAALNSIVAMYPDMEVHTFERQEREARAWLAGAPVSEVAHIKAISSERGLELNDLARKIIAKADAFAALSGKLIGHRQALETKAESAVSKEEIMAIEVSYDIYT